MLRRCPAAAGLLLTFLFLTPEGAPQIAAQRAATVDDFLAPGYPFELVSATRSDRIAWLAYERGRRNVYTAIAPAFRPVRLSRNLEDDGLDMTNLEISANGSVVVFVRGHAPNRDGWVANPTSDPSGSERTIWAARTAGGAPWKLGPGARPGPVARWRCRRFRQRGTDLSLPDCSGCRRSERPRQWRASRIVTAWGRNSNPAWSPDGSKLAFVSNRGDHSLRGRLRRGEANRSRTCRRASISTPARRGRKTERRSRSSAGLGRRSAARRRPVLTAWAILRGLPLHKAEGQGRGQGRGQGQGRGGRGNEDEGPQSPIPGLTRATFKGGYNLSFWVADVKTGDAREVWHGKPNDQTLPRLNAIQWAGDQPHLSGRARGVDPLLLGERGRRHDRSHRPDARRRHGRDDLVLERRTHALLLDQRERHR